MLAKLNCTPAFPPALPKKSRRCQTLKLWPRPGKVYYRLHVGGSHGYAQVLTLWCKEDLLARAHDPVVTLQTSMRQPRRDTTNSKLFVKGLTERNKAGALGDAA